jgi:hypothetical protein
MEGVLGCPSFSFIGAEFIFKRATTPGRGLGTDDEQALIDTAILNFNEARNPSACSKRRGRMLRNPEQILIARRGIIVGNILLSRGNSYSRSWVPPVVRFNVAVRERHDA